MRIEVSNLTQHRLRHIRGGTRRCPQVDWDQTTGDGVANFTYDGNGNRITRTVGTQTVNYYYDDEYQLIRAETDTGATPAGSRWKVEFVYDGMMRMRKQLNYTWSGATWGTATEVRFLYDGMLIVQERTGANAVVASYLRGLDLSGSYSGAGGIGGLLMRSAWNGTAYVHSYYHADGIGNITSLRKSDGTETASYRYEPFGRLVSTAPGAGTLGDVNKMRFSSKYLDGNTGFYYYGYRFYDTGTQKWLNRDPISEKGSVILRKARLYFQADESNEYSFNNNSAIGAIDKNGLRGFNPFSWFDRLCGPKITIGGKKEARCQFDGVIADQAAGTKICQYTCFQSGNDDELYIRIPIDKDITVPLYQPCPPPVPADLGLLL